MPKMKTNKAAKKRFHVTGSGKLVRTKGPKSHLRRKKAKRVKRLFGGKVELDSTKSVSYTHLTLPTIYTV